MVSYRLSMSSLTRRKSLTDLLSQASHSDLKRTLTAKSLVALGVGAIIGAALFILLLLTLLLVKGTQESAMVNGIIVAVKVSIVIIFIAIGWFYVNPANHTPFFIPATEPGHEGFFTNGWGGMLRGSGIVFFA